MKLKHLKILLAVTMLSVIVSCHHHHTPCDHLTNIELVCCNQNGTAVAWPWNECCETYTCEETNYAHDNERQLDTCETPTET